MADKKKIMFIYPTYGEPVTGGEFYDHAVVDTWAAQPHLQVDLFLEEDLHCRHKWLYPLAYACQAKRLSGYDIVLTNSRLYPWLFLLAVLLRLFTKTRLIAIHHHFDHMMYTGLKGRLRRWLEVGMLRQCAEVIIASPYIKDVFSQMLPNKTYHYWQLGLRQQAGQEGSLCSSQSDASLQNQVLFVGTLEPRKGVHHLLATARLFRQRGLTTRIVIVGKPTDEAYMARIEAEIQEDGLQDYFVFKGRQEMDALYRSYQESLCFAFPSSLEGYGMVLLEAMAKGCPCVVFNNSAMPYTVHDGENGLVVANNDSAAFAAAVVRMVEDKELRARFSRQCVADIAALPTFDNVAQNALRFANELNNEHI